MSTESSSDPFAEFAVRKQTGVEAWKERRDKDRWRNRFVACLSTGAALGASVGISLGGTFLGFIGSLGLAILGSGIGAAVGFIFGGVSWKDRSVRGGGDESNVLLGWMTAFLVIGTLIGAALGAISGSNLAGDFQGTLEQVIGLVGGEVLGTAGGVLAWMYWRRRGWVKQLREQIQEVTNRDLTS